MQIPILNGIYADGSPDYRTSYPHNLVPVPKQHGLANGYLRPSEGVAAFATGPGPDRGGIVWNGLCLRAMGQHLVCIEKDGTTNILASLGGDETVSMDYSFDVLGICAGGKLSYWDGATLSDVTDPDIGRSNDAIWIDGYWMSTDGEFIVVTDLQDRYRVNPLKYGSSEADPDRIVALKKLRKEVYALNRYTIEAFENIGGDNFPFARIPGATIHRGCIGPRAAAVFDDALAFVGSARNEPPAVYAAGNGRSVAISTREIERLLMDYTEEELSETFVESRTMKSHLFLYVHLPDRTLVYDANSSRVLGEPVWHGLTSGFGLGRYQARGFVWCYDQWLSGDPTSGRVGRMVDDSSRHYGAVVGWDFGTTIIRNVDGGAAVHELELLGLPGRTAFGADPTIWTSYSDDGETWSQERAIKAGKQGQRDKRMVWLQQGHIDRVRMQRFRGTSDAHIALSRLDARIEPFNQKRGNA